MKLRSLLLSLSYLILANGYLDHSVVCPNKTEQWTCDDYEHMRGHYGTYLENDLLCLGYDRNQNPDIVTPEPGVTNVIRASLKFTHINSLQDDTQVCHMLVSGCQHKFTFYALRSLSLSFGCY